MARASAPTSRTHPALANACPRGVPSSVQFSPVSVESDSTVEPDSTIEQGDQSIAISGWSDEE